MNRKRFFRAVTFPALAMALLGLAACDDGQPSKAPALLPRETVVPVAVVSQHFPDISTEGETGPNETSVGTPVASRSVVFLSADGKKKVTLSVDAYASSDAAASAYATAVEGSKAAPGFKPAPAPNLGEEAFAGTSQVGDEMHFGLGARDGRLIVSATHAGDIPVTTKNTQHLVDLGGAVLAAAKQGLKEAAIVPRSEPATCPKLPGAEELARASCFYLVVPEDRDNPGGRSIRLLVAKYPARSAEKRPDPVVYLAGGPGDIAPLEANGLIAANFIPDRDIYVMSQRGTMFAEPALTCAGEDDFARELLGLRFYSEATKRAHLAATDACHRELAAKGADLAAYNSTESAADFADLRKVLGVPTWNVYGTSYGTYLAQTLMRDHPDGIRSVVLDSVLPTTYNVAANWQNARDGFDNIFAACAAEPACNAAHPHLEQTFTGLVNQLEAHPLTATVKDPATGQDIKVVIDGGALVDWLRNQNYAVAMLQAAPGRIDGLAAGRPDAIEVIALDRASRAPPPGPDVPALGYGLSYGVSCRESYPSATPEDLAAAGSKAFPSYPVSITREGIGGWAYFNEDCAETWKVPAAPAAMHEPVVSPIPTLLLSGTFDTLTSLAGAKAAAAKLTSATIVSIPGVGHFVAPASPCAQAVVASFLADPARPDTSCVAALKPSAFTP